MATSQIKSAIQSILTQLGAIPYAWPVRPNNMTADMRLPDKLFQWSEIWNNQVKQWKEGKGFPNTKPCVFAEARPGRAMKLGLGATMFPDCVFRVHIVDWQIDAGDGRGIGQNTEIFAWRDLVKTSLQLFFPLQCGAMTQESEEEDTEHTDIYHYVMDFKCAFTDLKGGPLDPDQTSIIAVDPPGGQWGLNQNINIVDTIPS